LAALNIQVLVSTLVNVPPPLLVIVLLAVGVIVLLPTRKMLTLACGAMVQLAELRL
jgi:hypothetical protein